MAILNEYISCLVSSISEARAGADKLSAKMAESYYKNNSLLKHFPVPRMRIGNVSMEVPVAIDFTSEKTILKEGVDITVSANAVCTDLCNKYGISIPTSATKPVNDTASNLRIRITEYIKQLKEDAVTSNSVNFSSYTTTAVKDMLNIIKTAGTTASKGTPDSEIATEIESALKTGFLKTVFDQIDVVVESAKLKERDPQTFIKLKIDIVEEGMEWVVSEDGEKLIPE